MVNPVVWFEVTGRDGDSLRKFYRELLCWKIGAGDPASGFDYGLVDPGYGGLPGGIGSTADGGTGHATFYVEVGDPTAFLTRAESLGATTTMPEKEIPSLSLRFARFADPDGNIVGLSNNAAVGGRGDAGTNPVLGFEVMGRDPKALCKFYADLFGWRMSEAAGSGYWMVETGGDGALGGIGPAKATGRNRGAGFATFKVEVEDPPAVLERVEMLGGKTVLPATEVPGTTFKIAYFSDPDGHVIGLTKGMRFSR